MWINMGPNTQRILTGWDFLQDVEGDVEDLNQWHELVNSGAQKLDYDAIREPTLIQKTQIQVED